MNIVDEEVLAYLNHLAVPKYPELEELREREGKDFLIVEPDTERLMKVLLSLKQPRRILEVGCANGYSAAMMAMQVQDVSVDTIERHEERANLARKNWEELGLGNRITLHEGEASEVLQKMAGTPEYARQFDVLFIDAAKSHYEEYWEIALPMLAEHAMVLCDDILMRATVVNEKYDPRTKHRTSIRAMRRLLERIHRMEHATTTVATVADGLSITVYDGMPYLPEE